MGFYNKNYKKIDIDLDKTSIIDEGSTSVVYKYNDTAFKIFMNASDEIRMTESKFDLLSTIDNKHFIKLYDMFKVLDSSLIKSNKDVRHLFNNQYYYDGYTAKFYLKENINPLLEDSSYLLSNIEELRELTDEFTKRYIRLWDLHPFNVILKKDGIVFIDPDNYEVLTKNRDTLYKENLMELVYFITSLIEEYLKKDEALMYSFYNKLYRLSYREQLDYIEEKLLKVRRPIDIFK